MDRPHRGSALLAALILIAVLAVVTVATFRLAGISKGQAAKDARTLSTASCVETARQYLLGRLRIFGLDPTTMVLNQAIQIDNNVNNNRTLFTGHVRPTSTVADADGFMRPVGAPAVITSVQAMPPNLVGNASARNRDISNVIVPGPTLGGRAYRVVVACTDPQAGDMELEFTFKYGL